MKWKLNILEKRGDPDWAKSSLCYALILLMLGLQSLIQWPITWDFKHYAFYDAGAALKADKLVDTLRPGVDFAYPYGLVALDIGRGWFAAFGRTPLGYTSLTLVCSAIVALGMMNAALAMRMRLGSLALVILLLPYAIYPQYLNETHALESAVLIWAIAMQARGRIGTALALATLCLFIKPSMAYVYGFLLMVLIVLEIVRAKSGQRWAIFLRRFAPAGAVLLLAGAYCAARYGLPSLEATFFPATASRAYNAAHFGFFFGVGREFWWPTSPRYGYFNYYVFYEAGFWLLAAIASFIYLVVTATGAALNRHLPGRATLTLLSILLLHSVFVFFMYGWERSWIYYGYLLMLGTAGVLDQVPWRSARIRAAMLAAVVLVAAMGMNYRLVWALGTWRDTTAGPETAGLHAYPNDAADWAGVHQLLRDHHGLFLANGFTDGLFGDVRTPQVFFMSPSLLTFAELHGIHDQIADSTLVVRYKELEDQGLDPWDEPAYRDVTVLFHETLRTEHYIVMQRAEPTGR